MGASRTGTQTLLLCALAFCISGCGGENHAAPEESQPAETPQATVPARAFRVVGVFVALCDNKHQGIVKVPAALGDGQDPRNNLYWGARYGADTFFARSPHWKRVSVVEPPAREDVLARAAFVTATGEKPAYVVMSAYDGRHMKRALTDFLDACAGRYEETFTLTTGNGPLRVEAGGRADLVCFVGHNGLMDLTLETYPERRGDRGPEAAIVLACRSEAYFGEALTEAKCPGLLLTTGLMAPEAYTLDAALRSWSADEPPAAVREKSASAYAAYQKCSPAAARRLFGADRLR